MITLKNNLSNQIKKIQDKKIYQIDAKNLYTKKSNFVSNNFDFISYQTKIAQYNDYANILYITTKKYSQTTTKQQNQIKNNFVKYCNSKIIYTSDF